MQPPEDFLQAVALVLHRLLLFPGREDHAVVKVVWRHLRTPLGGGT